MSSYIIKNAGKLTKNEAQHFGVFKTTMDNLYEHEQDFTVKGNEERKAEMEKVFGVLKSTASAI